MGKDGHDPYAGRARVFDLVLGPVNRGLHGLGLKMLAAPPGARVLDVGSGSARLLRMLLDARCDAWGVEPSRAAARLGRQVLGAEGHRIVRADGARLPFPDASFDDAVFALSLHEMPAEVRVAALDEAMRVLRPGGRLLLADFHPGPPRGLRGLAQRAFIEAAELSAGREHYLHYRDFLRANGLALLSARLGAEIVARRVVAGGTLSLYVVLRT